MMFLVATTMVCDHCDGCVTTEIRTATTGRKSVMNQIESLGLVGEDVQNG
jgi:hypothetical protein